MSTHPEDKTCSDLVRVILLNTPPAVGLEVAAVQRPPAVTVAASAAAATAVVQGLTLVHICSSAYAHVVGSVGCMIVPQSIRQGDTGRCDQNGLG